MPQPVAGGGGSLSGAAGAQPSGAVFERVASIRMRALRSSTISGSGPAREMNVARPATVAALSDVGLGLTLGQAANARDLGDPLAARAIIAMAIAAALLDMLGS